MGHISDLPNDLMVKIFSLIPTKDVISTCFLTKKWCSVWKLVPKLEYVDVSRSAKPSKFIGKFLQLSNAPVLETLHLNFTQGHAPKDYETLINVAIARKVRSLELFHEYHRLSPIPLPMSLYTHETLVVLRLKKAVIEEVPAATCFRSLKTLSLLDVRFSSEKTVDRFLSCCPILETLVVHRWGYKNVKTFSIRVSSLESLKIRYRVGGCNEKIDDHGYAISAPSLKYLDIVDHFSGFCLLENIPEKLEAEIHLRHCDSEKLLECLTSSKNLSLCLKPQMGSYSNGDFDRLVSLELCVMCSLDWLNLILRHSPKLRALRFHYSRERKWSCRNSKHVRNKWEQPSASGVPECLLVSLETVEWFLFKGTEEEKNVVMYLLKNGNSIEKMSINFSKTITLEEKNQMQMELKSMQRISSGCQLSFT